MQIETNYKALYQVNPMLDDEFFFKKIKVWKKKFLKFLSIRVKKSLAFHCSLLQ
jgi:hypothetical protein